jgi:hypothetical protein
MTLAWLPLSYRQTEAGLNEADWYFSKKPIHLTGAEWRAAQELETGWLLAQALRSVWQLVRARQRRRPPKQLERTR